MITLLVAAVIALVDGARRRSRFFSATAVRKRGALGRGLHGVVMDGLPALALGVDAPDATQMHSLFGLKPLVSLTLVAAMVVSAAIHLLAVLVPGLRPVFRTFPMSANEWAIMLLLAASIVPAMELLKLPQRVGFVGRNLGPTSRRIAK